MKSTLNLRLPRPMIAQLDVLAERLGDDDELALRMGRVTRSLVARLALSRGIEVLQTEQARTPTDGRIGWRAITLEFPEDVLERAERLRPIVGRPIVAELATVLLDAVERGLREMERIYRERPDED